MGISFCLAEDINDARRATICVNLDEDIHSFLWENKDLFSDNIDLITELDPYGDKTFNKPNEIILLIQICKLITTDLSNNDFIEKKTNVSIEKTRHTNLPGFLIIHLIHIYLTPFRSASTVPAIPSPRAPQRLSASIHCRVGKRGGNGFVFSSSQ